MNLSETRPGGVPDSYLLDGTATSSVGACAAGTCLIIDGAMYGGQLFNSVTGATVDGVVTGNSTILQLLMCLINCTLFFYHFSYGPFPSSCSNDWSPTGQ